LDDLGTVVVSTPFPVGQSKPRGAWNEWCAQRRTLLPSGVDWGDPGLVLDLRGTVATVTLPPATRTPDRPLPGMVPGRLVTIAALAIVVLNVLDVITTRLALAQGATEGNPFASLFVHHLPIFVAIKVLFPGFVALRMWAVRGRTTPMLLAAMWWVVGVYSMAIVVNAIHLL
jgi:hypothetical protein